jgi:hypothetical protein
MKRRKKPRDQEVSAQWRDIDRLMGMASGPTRREWGTIGDLEILVSSDGTVVLCKGYREHGPSLEHPWLELTQYELRGLLARGADLLRASRRRSGGAPAGTLRIRRSRRTLGGIFDTGKTLPALDTKDLAKALGASEVVVVPRAPRRIGSKAKKREKGR